MIEVYYAQTRKYLKHKRSADEVIESVQQGRLETPNVEINVKCWHPHKQKGSVITLEKDITLPIVRCVDASGDLDVSVFTFNSLIRVSFLIWLCTVYIS